MIDWLELDLHQTLKCAAGNYFALERERMGDRREGVGVGVGVGVDIWGQGCCKFTVTPGG